MLSLDPAAKTWFYFGIKCTIKALSRLNGYVCETKPSVLSRSLLRIRNVALPTEFTTSNFTTSFSIHKHSYIEVRKSKENMMGKAGGDMEGGCQKNTIIIA
jgi:hypothetical protein